MFTPSSNMYARSLVQRDIFFSAKTQGKNGGGDKKRADPRSARQIMFHQFSKAMFKIRISQSIDRLGISLKLRLSIVGQALV